MINIGMSHTNVIKMNVMNNSVSNVYMYIYLYIVIIGVEFNIIEFEYSDY